MFLLDTNVLSELRRPDRAHPALARWAGRTAAPDLFISAITVFEIELGARLVARRDTAQGLALRAWIDEVVLPAFAGRILPVDTAVAQCAAGLHVPDPRPERDALIAATALVHRLRVVTRNVADFEPMAVNVLNPWE